MIMEETKRCPYCGEEILAVAKKCKHCGEWLEIKEPEKEKKSCPICGEMVEEELETCPYCHEPTNFADKSTYEIPNIKNNVSKRVDEYKKSSSPEISGFKPEVISPTKKSWRNNYGIIIIAILLFALIGGGYGIKQCIREKKQNSNYFQLSPAAKKIADNMKKEDDHAFAMLTKSPWYGHNSISITNMEEGWTILMNMVIDSEKLYTSDEKYTEKGTIIINFTCSNSDLGWSAEGEMRFHEKGEISIFSAKDMYEKTIEFSGDIIGTKVKYNNTNLSNDEIAMNVRLRLNDLIKEVQKSDESTRYMIKILSDNTLVLDEMDKNEVFKSTGTKLNYHRK